MERLNFQDFFLQAWRASISKKLPWLFGIVLAGAMSAAEIFLRTNVPENITTSELVRIFSENNFQEWIAPLFLLILLFLIGTAGRGNLIASLSFVAEKKSPENYPSSLRTVGKNSLRALALEASIVLVIFLAIGIVSLPLFIAATYNPATLELLVTLGIFTLIPILLVIFFIREYALLYLLLSPLSVRGAIEAGCTLFSRFIFPSLLLGLFLYVITTLFTFCLKLVILGITALSHKTLMPPEDSSLSLIIGFVFFTWFAIFQQALWIAFFKTIASTTKKETSTVEKSATFVENNLPETPSV
jgi:hypothetical protein